MARGDQRELLARVLERQAELERRLERIEQALGIARAVTPPPAEAPAPPPPPPPAAPRPPGLETRMGLTWINRAGVITLVIGIGFFFKYAVDNQWIGPWARVLLGALAGIAVAALGDKFWRGGQKAFAQGLTAAGIAIVYVSFYAAFGLYQLIPHAPAFLLLALNTAAAGALAWRYRAQAIAALALLGGYLTPLLLATAQDRPWVRFGFILILNAGAVVLAGRRGWRGLEAFALGATATLYGWWLAGSKPEHDVWFTFWALAFYLLFATRPRQAIFAGTQVLAGFALLAVWFDRPAALLPLLTAVCAAGLLLAVRGDWAEAPLTVFAGFWLPYAAAHAGFPEPRPVAAALVCLGIVFFLFLGWIPWRIQIRKAQPRLPDLVTTALNAGLYFGAAYSLLDPAYRGWAGLLVLALAALHLGVGWELRQALHIGIGIAFLTLAAPVQLTGFRITIAWALEAAALTWLGARAREPRIQAAALLVFVIVLMRLFAIDGPIEVQTTLLNVRFLTFLSAAISLWLAASWIRSGRWAAAAYIAAHASMLWNLILEALGWARRVASAENLTNVQSTSISILLAAYAVLLVAAGVSRRSALDRVQGLGLIGVVVLKLYVYDVWQISRMYRVAAFAALGILLLVMSYLYSRYRSSIGDWWRDVE